MLQRCRITGEDAKGAGQLAQLIAPLQGRDANVRFTVRQPGHRPRNGRQVRTEVTVDIPAGKTGDHHSQQRKHQNKQRAGLQFLMALRHPLFGDQRHLRSIPVDIAVEDRHQRFDMKHIPVDRQIALLKRGRERLQLMQLLVEVGEDVGNQRIAILHRQRGHHAVQLFHHRTRRGCFNGGNN